MSKRQVINPDLASERAAATLPVRKFSSFLFGGEQKLQRREEIVAFVESVDEFRDPKPTEFMSRSQKYENALRKVVAMRERAAELNPADLFEMTYYEQLVMGTDGHPLGLHFVMFIPTLQGQADDEQQAVWMPKALNLAIIGTYAQTELAHGTNLRNLETTATYDPVKQEFELHMPTVSATKWWPGNLGKSSNYAMVIAQLWSNGRCYGPHTFLVQIRDLNTHQPMPGVKVGDIGPKFGINTNDNGYLILNHVRIPRNQMMMRSAKVLPNGDYVKPPHAKLGYGAMMFVRSVMITGQALALARAVTIATRYSCVRRQGEMVHGKGEVKVLDYQTQQYRLFPELARSYAYFFAGKHMVQTYERVTNDIKQGNVDALPELHAASSGLKAVVSWEVAKGIEQCRLACGGHGYSDASGLPKLYGNTVGGCTYEGDNIVMLLQVARYLIKAVEGLTSGKQGGLPPITQYLARKSGAKSQLDQTLQFDHLLDLFEHAARRKAFDAVQLLGQLKMRGYSHAEAYNRSSVPLCKAARAHVQAYLVRMFIETVDNCQDNSVKGALEQLCRLFVLDAVSRKPGQFLEDNYLSRQQLQIVRQVLYETLAAIRPNAVALVDAWAFADRQLESVLGRFDGQVYDNLLAWAQHSELNDQQVFHAHHKYLGKMTMDGRSKL